MEIKKNVNCVNCKNYVPGKFGLCKIFANKVSIGKNKETIMYNFADHCRKDENLCGKEGWLYEDNVKIVNIVKTDEHKAKEKIFQYYRFLQIIKQNW